MTIRYIACLSLLFLTPIYVFGQNANDSLRQIWQNNEIHDTIRYKALKENYSIRIFANPDSALLINQFHHNLAKDKNALDQIIEANRQEAIINIVKGDLDKALSILEKANKLALDYKDPFTIAQIQSNMASVFVQQRKFQESVRNYTKVLQTFEETNNLKGTAGVLNNLGTVYHIIGEYELSLNYLNKALDKYIEIEEKDRLGTIWHNIGAVYLEQGKYNRAIEYADKALPIFIKNKNRLYEANAFSLLARSYKELGEKNKARDYGQNWLNIHQELNREVGLISSLTFMAELMCDTDPEEAIRMGEKLLARIVPSTDKVLKQELYNFLYKCYKSQGKLSESLEMHELYTIYNDSIEMENSRFELVREAIKNEFEVKLQEKQRANNKVQSENESKQMKKNVAFISLSLLILAGLLLYFKKNSNKNDEKRKALLKELEDLRSADNNKLMDIGKSKLDRSVLEDSIGRKLNETDWKVLNILSEHNLISNKEIAEKAHMSIDGIGSSLRRMYVYFEINETKYKKIALITKAIKLSGEAT